MSCYLIILYRKHYVFYRTLYNCTNRIHQALQHTYFISCFFNPNETCVWCIFRFIFKIVLPHLFLNCDYLFCLTCKSNQKNYERAESEETKKDKKKVFIIKKEFVRVHSFMTSAESLKFEPPPPSSPLCINIQFWSKRIPLLYVLNSHSNPVPF